MPPLPDVDSQSYQDYQADQFGAQTERRIGALGFSTAADSRIASLNDVYAPPPPPAPEPQSAPVEPNPPEDQPASAVSETAPETISGMSPTAPVTAPLVRPPAPAAPATSPSFPAVQPGGQDLVAKALNTADSVGLDPHLFVSLIQQESGFDPNVRSPVGAQGLSQLMPDTARGLGVTDPYDIDQNLTAGAKYLRQNLDRFGGDVVKALAAYNAGPGAVEKFGGVPPYEETQRYVNSIMGRLSAEQTQNPAGGVAPGPTEALPRVGADIAAAPVNQRDISQFGDPQLTSDEAYAACGPAAAVRFAQRFGRNPTLREATDLAKTVGWTPQQGMAGLSSEKTLMDRLNVPTKLVQGAQWDVFAKEATTGNPVTISTAGHYFTADGYNPDSGAFHVGKSGLDLKGGTEWMTPQQMQNLMGAVQGGLLADNPQVPTPSTADQDTNPVGWLDRTKTALGNAWNTATSAVGGAASALGNAAQTAPLEGGGYGSAPEGGQTPITAEQVVKNIPAPLILQGGMNISNAARPATDTTTPTMPTGGALIGQYERQKGADAQRANELLSRMQTGSLSVPDQQWLHQYFQNQAMTVGGIDAEAPGGLSSLLGRYPAETRQALEDFVSQQSAAGHASADIGDTVRQWMTDNPPPAAETAAPVNPFQLHTEPGPNRVALTPDQAVGHFEDITSRYQANDGRINELENQLLGGTLGKSGVVRPPGTVGWTDAEVVAYARQNGFDPYSLDGWPQMAGDAAKIAQNRPRNVSSITRQSPTQARAELAQLRAENEQIAVAAEHAVDNGGSQLYRAEPATPAPLPWDYNAGDVGVAAPATTAQESTGALARGGPQDTGIAPQGATAAPGARAPLPSAEPQLEPEIAASLPPGSGPLAEPLPPQSADVALRGLINEAKTRGFDTTDLEAQIRPPITADAITTGAAPPVQPPGRPPAPPVSGGEPPPRPPSELFTTTGEPIPVKPGITPETIQAAHERINRAYPGDWLKQEPLHAQLDQMLLRGAAPDQIARFLYGTVEGHTVNWTSVLRTVRTGSMAGGLTTEAKVALSPIIQTAMRAPVGAVKSLLTGNAGNIRAGLQGGIAGLSEASADALQTMKYGINYRSALGGGAQGGYGFAPGIDVMGKSGLARAAGTAALGLVRTHGAVADVSAGIGRGAALATGKTPEVANEIGQQWALRGGKYGTIGQAVSSRLEGLRRVNPALDVAGQILVPFFRVGYNAFTQGVERSPVGLAGTAIDVARAGVGSGPYATGGNASRAVTPLGDRLANNLFGVGLAGIGLAQAVDGNITGERPTPGSPKWSVRVPLGVKLGPFEPLANRDKDGNLWIPMRAFGPVQEALAQSAVLYEAVRDGKGNIPDTAARVASEYVGHVYDETWLRGMTDVLDMISNVGNVYNPNSLTSSTARRELGYTAQSLGQSFIPQQRLLDQISRTGLPKYVYSQGSPTPTPAPVKSTSTPKPTPAKRYQPPARATATPRSGR